MSRKPGADFFVQTSSGEVKFDTTEGDVTAQMKAKTYVFTKRDDQGRMGGMKFKVIGVDVQFKQDLMNTFGPGSGDIRIENYGGRYLCFKYECRRCLTLCHLPVGHREREIGIALPEFEFEIDFYPN